MGIWKSQSGSGGGLGNVTLTGTPSSGQVPTATSSTTATWQTPSTTTPADASITASQNVAVSDAGKTFIIDSTSGAVNLTILNDGMGLFVGRETIVLYHAAGANAVTFAAGSGVTLANPGGLSPAVGAFMAVRRVGTSAWAVIA